MTTLTPTGEPSMRAPRLSDERGIALAMAVFALVIIGVLVAGAFFSGRLEQRGGANSVLATEAFEAAEGGVTYTVNDGWNTATFNALAVGADAVQPAVSFGANVQAVPTVTKLNASVFLVRSEGQRLSAGNVLARRLVGTLVRAVIPDIQIEGALTVYGQLTLGGSAEWRLPTIEELFTLVARTGHAWRCGWSGRGAARRPSTFHADRDRAQIPDSVRRRGQERHDDAVHRPGGLGPFAA